MSTSLIYTKMSAIMRDIGAVKKAQTNTAQNYKFRGIDDFINALHPVLVAHGVFMTATIVSKEELLKDVVRSTGKAAVDKYVSLTVRYTFYAEDGSSIATEVASEGVDSGDKATNKAMSAALKYALIQALAVPTEDLVDGDKDSPTLESGQDATKTTSFRRKAAEPAGKVSNGSWT